MNPTQKESRGQASLVSKLTFLEVGRRFWLLMSVNILVVLLFFGGMIFRCDQIADISAANGDLGDFTASGYRVYESSDVSTTYRFDSAWLNDLLNLNGTVRNIFVTGEDYSDALSILRGLHYTVAIPKNGSLVADVYKITDPSGEQEPASIFYAADAYIVTDFALEKPVSVFLGTFFILLIFEAIGLINCIYRIRRSIRRALNPIYDLTLAAQNMNKTANPTLKLPGPQELHLSGAIDTLNNITENDLGRRIVITDEREELRGLAQAINAMLDRLDAAYRSQLRFVSDASHELRTPIAVIQGYANLLDRWGKNDQVTLQESIDAIKAEASGMQDLVEQLLFLARSDNQSITLNVENVDIYALADEVLRETQMIDPSHEFSSKLTESLAVRGDAQLLKQALRIFIDNAIKYTPSGGRITISTAGEGDYAKISVADNGIGIPAEDLSRVFDRFFRADESRTRETGGTGLGLSIAKWIIDRHGGYVEIVSREDIGTKVTVCLPKLKNAPDAPISDIVQINKKEI